MIPLWLDVDAAYGRIDGDLAVAAAAGVALGPHDPRFAGDVRLRYLQTAGLFGSVEAGDGTVGAFGIELRPLFIARWALGGEWQSPRVDLFLDSLGLEMGVAFVHPGGRRTLQVGLGLEAPIFEKATGPFIGFHAGARFSDNALAGNSEAGPDDRSLFLSISLGWQQIVRTHIVDLEEARRR